MNRVADMSATLEKGKIVAEHDAITVPIEITVDNAQDMLKSHLHKIQKANRRYEATRPSTIKMRETEWNRKRIKAEWSTFNAQLIKQDYRCASCKAEIDERAAIHADINGDIQGIVCQKCNVILAYARNDPYLLLQLIVYLLEDK